MQFDEEHFTFSPTISCFPQVLFLLTFVVFSSGPPPKFDDWLHSQCKCTELNIDTQLLQLVIANSWVNQQKGWQPSWDSVIMLNIFSKMFMWLSNLRPNWEQFDECIESADICLVQEGTILLHPNSFCFEGWQKKTACLSFLYKTTSSSFFC